MPNPDYQRCKECQIPVDVPVHALEKHTEHFKQDASKSIVERQAKLI